MINEYTKILFIGAMLFVIAIESHAGIDRNNWMAVLPDRAPLLTLSIPGTHNAGTKGFSWSEAETKVYAAFANTRILA